jgi:hypothetical protein
MNPECDMSPNLQRSIFGQTARAISTARARQGPKVNTNARRPCNLKHSDTQIRQSPIATKNSETQDNRTETARTRGRLHRAPRESAAPTKVEVLSLSPNRDRTGRSPPHAPEIRGPITINVSGIERRSRPRTGLRCGRKLQQLAILAVGEHVHGTVLEHPNVANALVQVAEERFLVDHLVVLT